MSTFNINKLRRLGDADRELQLARKRFARAASIASPQRHRVEEAEAELSRLSDASKTQQREVKRLEGDAEAKKAEVTKNTVALNQAKSNDEYQALKRTIAAREAELSEIETQILEAYEAQDERVEREKACGERLKQQRKELASAMERVKAAEAEAQAEIDKLEAERESAAAEVAANHRELYERIFGKLGDTAIAEIIDENCQGCFMKARPEQISKVRGEQELITCTTCGRILWGDWS